MLIPHQIYPGMVKTSGGSPFLCDKFKSIIILKNSKHCCLSKNIFIKAINYK
jgi:hypothetical protein